MHFSSAVTEALLELSFRSRFWCSLLNKIMMVEISKRQKKEKRITVNVDRILLENNLRMVKTGFFHGKKTIARVKDASGKRFILKTGRVDPFQAKLFEIAKRLEGKVCFKVPSIIKQGGGWILFEEIEGKLLNDFYEKKPDWCVEISKKIADDYQLVTQEIQKTQNLGDLLAEGKKWFLTRLNLWSKPIIDAKIIDFSLIRHLKKEFEDVINRKRENFFSWVHGNIIGDHIIVSDKEEIFLLDLVAEPRAGRGYYDFLRALDFMFLKSRDEERIFTSIPGWIKQHLSDFDEKEVKLVFAFRVIGVLGWDILKESVEYVQGNVERKKQLALNFIRREY